MVLVRFLIPHIIVEAVATYKSTQVQSESTCIGHKSQSVQTDEEGKKSVHTQTKDMVSITESKPDLQGMCTQKFMLLLGYFVHGTHGFNFPQNVEVEWYFGERSKASNVLLAFL